MNIEYPISKLKKLFDICMALMSFKQKTKLKLTTKISIKAQCNNLNNKTYS